MSINFLIFAFIVIVYCAFAIWQFRQVKSPYDFFHGDNLKKNSISLIVANVTLGSGFIYLVQGGSQNGVLFLIVPFGLLFGYMWLASIIRSLPENVMDGKNLLDGLNRGIEVSIKSKSHFKKIVTYSLILVFCMLLAYEIFVSSQLCSVLIFKSIEIECQVILSLVISCIALGYTLLGGYRGVVRSDILQAILILGCVIVFAIMVFLKQDAPIKSIIVQKTVIVNLQVYINVLMAFLFALATQFYSIMNIGALSHHDTNEERHKLLVNVSIVTTILLLVLVFLGIIFPSTDNGKQQIISLIGQYDSLLMYLVLILGFTSIVFSTIDTLIITITMMYYDNIADKDSRVKEVLPLKEIRIKVLAFLVVVLILLGFFNYLRANIFYLLIGIGGGVSIFASLIFLACHLAKRGKLGILTNEKVNVFLALFVSCYVSNIVAFVSNNVWLASYNALIFFILSVIYTWFVSQESRSSE